LTGPPSTEETLPNATFRKAKMTCSSALGYRVRSLKRVRIMNIKLDVPTGKYRELSKEELLELNKLLENSSKTYE
jgi:23S rRNA pseudouridine2604 synthase